MFGPKLTSNRSVSPAPAGGPDAGGEVGDTGDDARGPRRWTFRLQLRQTDARVVALQETMLSHKCKRLVDAHKDT